MRFLRIDQVPRYEGDVVFRASAVRSVVMSLSLLGLMVMMGAMIWYVSWWFAPILLLLSLFVPFIILSIRARINGDDWVVRMQPSSLIVRLRSHLNRHFPREDLVAVELDRHELAGFSRLSQRLLREDSTGQTIDANKQFLHIHLRADQAEVDRLRQLIAAERTREAPPRGCLGSKIKYDDYPASLVDRDGKPILRVEWLGPATLLTPRLKRAMSILSRLAPVLKDTEQTVDVRNLKQTDPDAESQLIALVESGDIFTAIRTARQLYGLSLIDAKAFVEQLAGAGSCEIAEADAGKKQ